MSSSLPAAAPALAAVFGLPAPGGPVCAWRLSRPAARRRWWRAGRRSRCQTGCRASRGVSPLSLVPTRSAGATRRLIARDVAADPVAEPARPCSSRRRRSAHSPEAPFGRYVTRRRVLQDTRAAGELTQPAVAEEAPESGCAARHRPRMPGCSLRGRRARSSVRHPASYASRVRTWDQWHRSEVNPPRQLHPGFAATARGLGVGACVRHRPTQLAGSRSGARLPKPGRRPASRGMSTRTNGQQPPEGNHQP